MSSLLRVLACAIACGTLAACSSMPEIDIPTKKIDYKSAGRLPSLEIPPDLSRPSTDERFNVPNAATYSDYQRNRDTRPDTANSTVLPSVEGVHVERAGAQRWLVVQGDPDKLWPVVKDFWQETGFLLNVELPEAGVMETDWNENRARINDGMIRNVLGRLLGSATSTSERDKFRTRLERGAQPGTTEIYISHRGMEEVVASSSASSGGPEYTKWQPRAPDPDLEAEMLRRLMVRFGVQEARAKEQIAVAPVQPRAVLKRAENRLTVDDQFDRAWRRVGLALDRVGFTVEDRDRSNGIYYVRYIDPEADNKQQKGWFSKLKFWQSDEPKKEQYRVVLKDAGNGTEVAVQTKDGAAETSSTGNRILTLLYDQLK
jgi:outer membrane protein assembly factor BamC